MANASRRADAPPPRVRYERSAGAASAPLPAGYRRREPEKTVLHAIVRDHLETFLEEPRRHDGDGYPAFLEREFRRYLRCGLLAPGFARLRAPAESESFTAVSPALDVPAGAASRLTYLDASAPHGATLDYRVEIDAPEGTVVAGPIRVATRGAMLALEVTLRRPRIARIDFELPRRGAARIEVVAVTGRRVALLQAGVRDAGQGELEWDARTAAAGVYFVRLLSPEGSIAKRLIVW